MSSAAEPAVVRLRAATLTDPIGLEDPAPDLSWQFVARDRDVLQSAYQIRAASDPGLLDRPDLWDTGEVRSARNAGIRYQGYPVSHRTRVAWQVRAWDQRGRVSGWSAPAYFERGLRPDEWSAQWIGNPQWEQRVAHPIVVDVGECEARYVRIDVHHLAGSTVDPFESDRQARLQLVALEIGEHRGAMVTASESDTVIGEWEPRFLTDGTDRGYRSLSHPSPDLGTDPIRLWIDLGAVRRFDQVRLHPRSDLRDQFARTADYPRDFGISVSTSPEGLFAEVKKVSRQSPPSSVRSQPEALPRFVKDFTLGSAVRSARLHLTGSAMYDARVNGSPVGKAVLEPPNTDFGKQLVASAYDVTSLLRIGDNRIAIELGPGLFDVHNTPDAPDRFQYLSSQHAPPRLLAQLEIASADGRSETISSDRSWLTGLGATTFSNWYGGEDYDARRETPGWDRTGSDLDGWQPVAVTGNPLPTARIIGRTAPPIEPVETLPAVGITEPRPQTYVVDFGVNVAGWPELVLQGPSGSDVELRPAEKLCDDGTITQSGFRGPVWDTVTLDGGRVRWHPRFMYHGFRYVQITGLTSPPALDLANAIVLRTANETAGSFSCSDELLNGIHRIIDRAVQSNMFSVLTDCPHREKLGWLEQYSLVFGTVARGYDVQAYYRKLLRDVAEAQTPSGMVPDIAPEYTEFSEWDVGYRHDANWGGSIILAPWLLYRTYGDRDILSTYYPNMRRYLAYLDSLANGGLLDGGLGDWIAIDTSTPRAYTASYAYLRLTRTLGKIAAVLGHTTVDLERQEAEIAAAFNATYLDRERHTYASGSQAADALALDLGIVPADQTAAVLGHLIANIRAKGNHLDVGEIGLPAVLNVLSAAGRDDVVYDIVTQRTPPGYGAQLLGGSTSLGEAWDGLAGDESQNHFMLGAIDEWFTKRLAGIRQSADREVDIRPSVVGDLTEVSASYRTPQGEVRSRWQLTNGSLRLEVTVPANAVATVAVPLGRLCGATARVTATAGAEPAGRSTDAAVYRVGSGDWIFEAR